MTHPLLGRNYVPDTRDRGFLMERKLPEVAPIGARLWDIPFRYDQGQTPACTGYSSSNAMSALYWHAQRANVQFDAAQLYKWANAHDGDPTPHEGSSVRAAFQGLVMAGDDIIVSNDEVDKPGTYEKVQNYVWADVENTDADIDRVITWILNVSPVVIGITWYQDMFSQDPNTGAFVTTDGYIHPTGAVAGGHAICVRGVNALDANNTFFVLRNSWGPWGISVGDDWTVHKGQRRGDILLDKADMVSLLTNQGEAGALVDNLAPLTAKLLAPPSLKVSQTLTPAGV